LRATDAPGARVIPPTAEIFPAGEGAALPLAAGGEPLSIDYEGAGAYATLEGSGTLSVAIDDGAPVAVRADGAGLYELSSHPRHERHRLAIGPGDGGLALWSLSFAPGVP
jgi:hypothetical protein